MNPTPTDPDLIPIIIAVPITLYVKREHVGFFMGPCYLYRATFSGTFHMADQTGSTPEEAAWRMAVRLKGALSA